MNANPRFFLACTLTAALLNAGGCTATPAGPPASSSSAASAVPATAFGGTDRAWIELLVYMDEQLLPVLRPTPDNGADPRLRTLATQLTTFLEAEITALRTLHTEAGLPAANPHHGMPMPGTVSAEQIAAARSARGAAFDTLLRAHVRGYLEQAAHLAASEQEFGEEARTRALAEKAAKNCTSVLAELNPAPPKGGAGK